MSYIYLLSIFHIKMFFLTGLTMDNQEPKRESLISKVLLVMFARKVLKVIPLW